MSSSFFKGQRYEKSRCYLTIHLVCSDDLIAMGGGGDGFGLYIDGIDLSAGMTSKCQTFGNEPLVPGELNSELAVDFKCQVIEVWCFVPKLSSSNPE